MIGTAKLELSFVVECSTRRVVVPQALFNRWSLDESPIAGSITLIWKVWTPKLLDRPAGWWTADRRTDGRRQHNYAYVLNDVYQSRCCHDARVCRVVVMRASMIGKLSPKHKHTCFSLLLHAYFQDTLGTGHWTARTGLQVVTVVVMRRLRARQVGGVVGEKEEEFQRHYSGWSYQ